MVCLRCLPSLMSVASVKIGGSCGLLDACDAEWRSASGDPYCWRWALKRNEAQVRLNSSDFARKSADWASARSHSISARFESNCLGSLGSFSTNCLKRISHDCEGSPVGPLGGMNAGFSGGVDLSWGLASKPTFALLRAGVAVAGGKCALVSGILGFEPGTTHN